MVVVEVKVPLGGSHLSCYRRCCRFDVLCRPFAVQQNVLWFPFPFLPPLPPPPPPFSLPPHFWPYYTPLTKLVTPPAAGCCLFWASRKPVPHFAAVLVCFWHLSEIENFPRQLPNCNLIGKSLLSLPIGGLKGKNTCSSHEGKQS